MFLSPFAHDNTEDLYTLFTEDKGLWLTHKHFRKLPTISAWMSKCSSSMYLMKKKEETEELLFV